MKPDTSLDAKDQLSDQTALKIKVKDALRQLGSRGGTTEEVAAFLGLDPKNGIWKRFSEIEGIGRTGERRKLSSGRTGFVWFYGVEDNIEAVYSKGIQTAADKAIQIVEHTINKRYVQLALIR